MSVFSLSGYYYHSLFLFLLFSLSSSTPDDDQLRSLLEFKKGILNDPIGKIFNSWKPPTSSPDPTACPTTFYGVTCDNSGYVAAISLDGLNLSGDLKFNTLNPLKMLRNLTLSSNQLTGRLPPALGLMSSLQYLDLSNNQFYGPIPERINDLWGLHYLNLSRNNFSGGYPNGIQNLQQMKVFDLHLNQLWGDVGILFSLIRNVEEIDLSCNEFFGSLSSLSVENVSGLANTVQVINLSKNRLTGGFFVGESIGLFRNLRVVDLGYNQLNGVLPSFGALPSLKVLRMGNNQLYGGIPEELLQSLIPLEELDLSGNGFSGSVHRINSTTLSTLNLSSNLLSGSLPPSLGSCVIVDLSNNNLSDDIKTIQIWESPLEMLDLSSNKLTGNIPNLTSQFQKLTVFSLGNNSLSGTLPPILESCPRLSVVDLSLNELKGSIPGSFFTTMSLTNLNLSSNHLTGSIPFQDYQAKPSLFQTPYPPLESLDLSNNSLSGTLPPDIGNLGRLKLLNLGNNQLSGGLPNELNNLYGLEYLDLSRNNFVGSIPRNLSSNLKFLNVSYNNISGSLPENLRNFPDSSFHPGNTHLDTPNPSPGGSNGVPDNIHDKHHRSKSKTRIAIIVVSVLAVILVAVALLVYHRSKLQNFHVRTGFGSQTTGRDVRQGRSSRPPTSLSFSNDHLLTSKSRSLSGGAEIAEHVLPASSALPVVPNLIDIDPATSERKSLSGSPVSSSPRFIDAIEQPVTMDVYSPDRLAGELFFLDSSLTFTAEELSRAPAEVLGRSSHGTLYKATLGNGHMLTVKWLRVGLVKHKKEFAKEVKKIGSLSNANVVPLRAYYWGPREQERLILADYIQGDSLALHLYETTPRRYSLLSFSQRLKVAVDVARCLSYLHEKNMPHGNLKPTNIILSGPDYNARLTDYGLHRLMTPAGIAEQILNLGALGYRSPELATAGKPVPTFKADVYALGVIIMELLTRRSAGDIISGQSGAVDLTDWVRLCNQEGRGMDCIDRDIAGGEEQYLRAMEELLAVSLRCILPVNERPHIRQVLEDISSISI